MTNNSLYLRVIAVACDEDKIAFCGLFSHNFVYARYKRAGSIKHFVAFSLYLTVNIAAYAVGAYDYSLIGSKLVNGVYYPCSFCLHIVDNVLIVYDRTESSNVCILFKLAVNHFHGSVNSEAEACGFCNSYLTH